MDADGFVKQLFSHAHLHSYRKSLHDLACVRGSEVKSDDPIISGVDHRLRIDHVFVGVALFVVLVEDLLFQGQILDVIDGNIFPPNFLYGFLFAQPTG